MTLKINPWGMLDWIYPKIKVNKWHVITSSSFEARSIALGEWLVINKVKLKSSSIFHIENPPSENWNKSLPLRQNNYTRLQSLLNSQPLAIIEANLLEPALKSVTEMFHSLPDGNESILLDITTLPKRFALLVFQKLMDSKDIKNLLVTYSKAENYPEMRLSGNPLPSQALQGFGRIEDHNPKRFIVGVGYVALNIEELLNSSSGKKLDFVFPFPPASPGFRRNWNLLSKLIPNEFPSSTEIHLVNSMDAFEVSDIVTAWGGTNDLNIVPLGPKPHALGMAMAYMKLNGTSELSYPQPQVYQYNYSEGILKNSQGVPQIIAYYLKRNGERLF